jgi:membrane protein DedA with SNARE-associated domain
MPWDDFRQYAGVFLALVISAFGVPIPEELPIITGGVLVGKEWDNPNSWMKWWLMLPVCIAGVVVCDIVLYVIGRKWGYRLLDKKWFQKHILPIDKRARIERNFHEYGIIILLVARLLPGIRSPIFIMSGVMKVPFRKFLIADGLYAIPGVNLLFWLSYWFTDQFLRAFQRVEGNRPLVTAVILAAVSGFLIYKFLVKRNVTTGDPEELPVIGSKVASMSHHMHMGQAKGEPADASPPVNPPPPETPGVTGNTASTPEKT